MRLRKRVSAVILAIAMIVSSVQIPGGTAYAAQMAGSGVESGQEASVLTAEGTESIETAGEDITQPSDNVVTDDGDQKGDEAPAIGDEGQTGDDTPAGGNSQTGDDVPADDGNQQGDDTPAGDDSEQGDDTPAGDDNQQGDDTSAGDDSEQGSDMPAGDDNQQDDDTLAEGDDSQTTGDEADGEEETDDVSGNDLEKSVLNVDEVTDEALDDGEMTELTLDGAYQFGGAPAKMSKGRMSVYAAGEYNEEAAECLYQGLLKREKSITVVFYNIKTTEIQALFAGVLNEHPDLYYVKGEFSVIRSVSTSGTMTNIVAEVRPTYDTGYDDEAFYANTKDALACITDGMSDYEKAVALHDYLAVNIAYDNDNYEAGTIPQVSYTAYGALVNGVSVCQGYALAYKYLLSKAGIESYMVTSDTMNHAWNLVKIGDNYYHVDITFDDPARDRCGGVEHIYLLCSDSTLKNHNDWVVTYGSGTVDYKAEDDTYQNAFWKKSNAPLVFDGGSCYYITEGGSLRKADFSNSTDMGTELVAQIGQWSADSGSYYTKAYSGLYMIGGRLFFNDAASIYSIATDGTDRQTAFTAQTDGGYSIFGSAYRGSTVFYVLSPKLPLDGNESVLIADIEGDSPDEPVPPEETKEGWGIDNLTEEVLESYELKNACDIGDGVMNQQTVPRADGKPAVIFFFNGSNSSAAAEIAMFKDVRQKMSAYFSGSVNFYAINQSANDDEGEAAYSYVKDNGIDDSDIGSQKDINWLYGSKASALRWAYGQILQGKFSLKAYPFLIYIDRDDKIQYATGGGGVTAKEILTNLRQYCGYNRFSITYENMDGCDNPNPEYYESSDTGQDCVLQNPSWREGYRFDGWYKDSRLTRKATSIPTNGRNDFTLYAKWVKGAYRLGNPTQTYKTTEGGEVTTAADSRPKLLYFYPAKNSPTGQVLCNLSQTLNEDADHDLHGVDIYVIMYEKSDRTHMSYYDSLKEAMKDEAGYIKLCYNKYGDDDNDSLKANDNEFEEYAKLAGLPFDDTKLVTFYIDANNRLQYASVCDDVSQGVEPVMENLQVYCQYPNAAYKIEYVLDGGTNDSGNPNIYHSGMGTIVLKAPTRDGYRFEGWYKDAAFTQPVTEIPEGSKGDIKLYARWEKRKGLDYDNFDQTYKSLDGTELSSKADGKPKVLFFFKTECVNCQQTNTEISRHIKVFAGADIYAVEINQGTEAEVTAFRSQYGCDEIPYSYDTTTGNWDSLNAYARKAELSSIKTPFIAYIDADNRWQHYTMGNMTWMNVMEALQEYCGYNYYAVSYVLGGGKNSSENPEVYQGGSDAITLKDATRNGYRFDGWYKDAQFTQKVTQIPAGSRENLTLYAKWTKTGEGYYEKNQDYTFTTLDGETVSVQADGKPKLLIFLTANTRYAETGNGAQTVKELKQQIRYFAGADIYVVDVAQNTKEDVTKFQEKYGCDGMVFTYDTTGDAAASSYYYLMKTGLASYKYPGIAYIDAENYFQYITTGTQTWTQVFENLQKYCYYDYYRIDYVLDGGTNDSANPDLYQSGKTVALREPVKRGFSFEGWYKDAEFTEQITEISADSRENLTLYAKWGEGGKLNLDNLEQTYKALDGKTLSSGAEGRPKLLIFYSSNAAASQNTVENIKEIIDHLNGVDVYAISGLNVDREKIIAFKEAYGCDGMTFAEYDLDDPDYQKVKAYAAATGLSDTIKFPILCYIDKDNKLQWATESEQTGEQVLENLKKYCDYSEQEQPPAGTFKITYELNGGTNSSENPETYTAETETITLKDPVKEGYIFEGWYRDAEFSERVTQIDKGSTGDITLYAKWKEETVEPGTYRITYELDGGTNDSENPETYTAETETITLKDPVKEGYIFEGWYKDAEFKEQVKEIAKGSTGDITLYAKWKEADAAFTVTRPDRTTYKVGEELDVTGGKVTVTPKTGKPEEIPMTLKMLTGFDSSKPGICKVMVTSGGYTGSFDVLIVEVPEIKVPYGQTLADVTFPESEYGTYAWADGVETDKALKQTETLGVVFTPKDTEKFQTLELQVTVMAVRKITDENTKIEFLDGPYVYKKEPIHPKVKVIFTGEDGEQIELVEGQDYERVGEDTDYIKTAGWVYIDGINGYTGGTGETFTIERAIMTLRAKDKVICVGDPLPDPAKDYEYELDGLYEGDEWMMDLTSIWFECDITDTSKEGEYEIKVHGLHAYDDWYMIRRASGTLYVVSELVTHTVTFDVQGHGTAPKTYTGIAVGATIDRPEEPTADGYRFGGWYKDAACTKAWDFGTDTVQADLTLYAKWLGVDSEGEFAVQEIADVTYNGKAQKPAISVYDDDTLLKAGRDYTIKYYNNINANTDGVLKGGTFNGKLPYAEITGKGNYKETVKVNFNILPAPLGDGEGNPAAGVALKINDHLVKSTGVQKPFKSIKKGRSLKEGTDYELILRADMAYNSSGGILLGEKLDKAEIPANYSGEFRLTVKGKGNYEGGITRTVYVAADKAHQMKNVKIILGSDLKRGVIYTGSPIRPTPVEKAAPGDNEFVVKYGNTVLKPYDLETQTGDYLWSCENDGSVGKAELVVTGTGGKGGYTGRKTITFNIKGRAFTNKMVTVEGLESNKAYTGKAAVQNKNVKLTYAKGKTDEKQLEYGKDYTISYTKNVNKGTATMTFTGLASAGYSGKVSKKFKIGAANIADESQVTRDASMQTITVPYSKAGAKPVDEIILTNAAGIRLQNGRDYTLSYKNNKAVADTAVRKAPTVTVKGKGNYTGSFEVKFTIAKADLRGEAITIECAQTAYNGTKTDSYPYTPAVKVKDGKKALKAGTDYEIAYVKNTKGDYEDYRAKLQAGTVTDEDIPRAVITEKAGSAYTLQGEIVVPLQVYMTKLKKADLDVKIKPAVYTGGQVRPEVTVAYMGTPLTEGVDYKLTYGANNKAGKNKGSVTVTGLAPQYGGSVAYKFNITQKDLKYWFGPVIGDEK